MATGLSDATLAAIMLPLSTTTPTTKSTVAARAVVSVMPGSELDASTTMGLLRRGRRKD